MTALRAPKKVEQPDAAQEMLTWLFNDAITHGASDIHLSPFNKTTIMFKYRIDGSLRMRGEIKWDLYREVVYKIKTLCGLQRGDMSPRSVRLKLEVGGKDIHSRIETAYSHVFSAPIVTIRIIPSGSNFLDIDKIGFKTRDLFSIKTSLHKKMGIILVSGPTGSGKTTTLYACIRYLAALDMEKKEVSKNIITIENPVDTPIPGITQLEARDNVTIEELLKSAMRHDPDVLLVGEIRDNISAHEASKAGQSGHLVLTTVHSNSALSAITRMINFGLDTYSFVTSTRAVLSQRLVPKLCRFCRVETQPSEIEKLILDQAGGKLPEHYYAASPGCEKCQNGYFGRKLIYEFFPIDPSDQDLILSSLHERISLDRHSNHLAEKHNTHTLQQNLMTAIGNGEISVKDAIKFL